MALADKIQIGPDVIVVSSGGLVANDQFSGPSVVVDNSTLLFPDFRAVIVPNFSVAPVAGSVIEMYLRHVAVDGVNSSPAPGLTYPHDFIYSFKLDSIVGAQYLVSPLFDAPEQFSLSFKNSATGQDLPAGWSATVKLRGYGS